MPHQDTTDRKTPRRSLRRRGARLLIIIASIYLAWCLLLYFLQDRMMFPRDLAGAPTPDEIIPPFVERLWITADDGSRVEAWFIHAQQAMSAHQPPTVISTHGNAELIDQCLGDADRWRVRGYNVLLCEYRGYGRSSGKPGERAIIADLEKLYDLLAARPDLDKNRIIAHGRSIGAGAAAQLAARRPVAGLILESPFKSAASFALRFGAPPFIMKSPFRTDRVLAKYDNPVLIIHGIEDEIIPIAHARRLHALCATSTMVELHGGHNSGISGQSEYWDAIDAWLSSVPALHPSEPRP